MKRRLTLLLAVSLWLLAANAQKTKTLTILHTNDTHSCILPLNAQLADTMLAGRGGYLRRMALIEEERKQDPDLLVIDSGDFSQGSSYYSLFKGDVEIGLMNRMGVVATTIGNHEFDFGLDNMARIFRMANFPVVCANYRVDGTPLQGVVKPYHILKVKGIKVGIFGLAPKLDGLVDSKNYGEVEYLDPIQTANDMARTLREKERCEVVICISHLGWTESGVGDQEMISHSRGIDLVLGGHTHSYFKQLRYVTDLDGREVPVDQNGKSGIYVGKIKLTLSRR